MKVLFVQERPFLSTALKMSMQRKGFDLVLSENMTHARSVIDAVNPKVVIADISAGHCFNYIVEAKKKNVPVIVISANEKEDELQKAFDKGADDYICLPLSISELTLRVCILSRHYTDAVAPLNLSYT